MSKFVTKPDIFIATNLGSLVAMGGGIIENRHNVQLKLSEPMYTLTTRIDSDSHTYLVLVDNV